MMKGMPKHIAVIMDGNGRWAQRRLLPRVAGHHRGVESARNLVKACIERGIEVLTLFAFSSENWQRSVTEVKLLMTLLQKLLTEEVKDLHANGVKLQIIGDVNGLQAQMQMAIKSAENLTKTNTGLQLNIAINYGGRWDIVNAAKTLCEQVAKGDLLPEQINEEIFNDHISTSDLPDPDLLIRTSGEQRVSNFLLWQLAYSEIFFTDTLWPDFDTQDLDQALEFFNMRQRRFGLVENV